MAPCRPGCPEGNPAPADGLLPASAAATLGEQLPTRRVLTEARPPRAVLVGTVVPDIRDRWMDIG